ncbi:hypothetical protein [Streptomyces sp. WAC08241]|uniref:hypothetical protein n=1 Tax=Streptomyces sp. WAC08241 TaxID=2487421 RepID=UPI000F775A08|nr:hypothetical protein [Streptomyces sp. WAC08241]RSS43828.1 hypothetical protein EF906_08750 [Streptomyces sp. WAC08241]
MPTKTTPPQMTARERLLARQRPTLKMTICDDLQVKTDLDIARFELRKAKSAATDDPKNPNLTAAVAAAEQNVQIAQEAFDAAAIILRFEALPRPAFEELKKKHPPTEAQAEEGTALNFETLAPELIAAASLDGLTVDDARTFLDTWGEGESITLFDTAWNVQQSVRADVGKD